MNTPSPPFSQKLLVMTLSVALGIDFSSVANAVSVITMDGTTGTAGAVTIPATTVPVAGTYIIDGATNGTVNSSGTTLFFSFSQFGIGAGDTALFQCFSCTGVTNVISRVTGVNPSNINGTLTSTIGIGSIGSASFPFTPANFWFFNPNGVILGSNAVVDIGGSFVTNKGIFHNGDKADKVIFSNNDVFGLTSPTDSTLTVATPTSFGFPVPVITPTPVPPPTSTPPTSTPPTSTPPTSTPPTSTPPTSTPTPTPTPTPAVVIEAPPLQISPQGDISMVVATQPVLTVAIPPLPKSMNPCNSDGQSTLISKGVANYVPQASSQVPQSIVGTTAGTTSLASIDQTPPSTSNEESDDCL